MSRNIIWTVILSIIAGLLQSTLLGKIAVFNVVPDLALCIVVYSAYINGSMTGQVSGFLSGLLLDFLSAAPLGLNCFVRIIIGAVTGIFKGSFFLDTFFMPVILCTLATIAKAVIIFIVNIFAGDSIPIYSLASSLFWIELGLNAVSAPLLFFLLKRFKYLNPVRGANAG